VGMVKLRNSNQLGMQSVIFGNVWRTGPGVHCHLRDTF
jgi:hypothetical protein